MTLEDTQTRTTPMTSREVIYLALAFMLMGVGIGLHGLDYLNVWWSLAIASLPGGFLLGITNGTSPVHRRVGIFFCAAVFAIMAGACIWVASPLVEKISASVLLLVGMTMILTTVEELLKLEERSKT